MNEDALDNQAMNVLMLQANAEKRGNLNIWTIYDKPTDYPHGFCARRHEVSKHGPLATDHLLMGELSDLRLIFLRAGLHCLNRQEEDEPQIVESWV
jgi:hypothetical protein